MDLLKTLTSLATVALMVGIAACQPPPKPGSQPAPTAAPAAGSASGGDSNAIKDLI